MGITNEILRELFFGIPIDLHYTIFLGQSERKGVLF
jgi:hypothetical protein